VEIRNKQHEKNDGRKKGGKYLPVWGLAFIPCLFVCLFVVAWLMIVGDGGYSCSSATGDSDLQSPGMAAKSCSRSACLAVQSVSLAGTRSIVGVAGLLASNEIRLVCC
jgi:hypothetical protein